MTSRLICSRRSIWQLDTGDQHHSGGNNGTIIAVGHPGFNVRYALVIDTVIGSEIRTIHVENGIYSAKITPDGSKVIIGDVDNDMTIWDIRSRIIRYPCLERSTVDFKHTMT